MQLKTDNMAYLKLKQLKHEVDTWKRSVGFMSEENIRLKNRIAEVLKDPFDHNLLEQLECFQSSFIREDELISFLQQNLAEVDNLLVQETFENDHFMKEFKNKLNDMRKVTLTAERQFGILKLNFNDYLSEHL